MAYLWDINGSSMGHQWLNPKEGLEKMAQNASCLIAKWYKLFYQCLDSIKFIILICNNCLILGHSAIPPIPPQNFLFSKERNAP
jgi:hypothetical protein